MKKFSLIGLLLLVALLLVACDTDDTSSDASAAQSLQPAIVGFTTQNLDTGATAILTTAAGTAITTGNVPLAAAIQRGDALLQCLQDTGALSGLLYLESNPTIVPQVGASIIINKTRVQRNVFSCLTDSGFTAQGVNLEPCAAHGEFTFNNEQFWFAYVGAGDGLCTAFETHYTGLNVSFLGRYP